MKKVLSLVALMAMVTPAMAAGYGESSIDWITGGAISTAQATAELAQSNVEVTMGLLLVVGGFVLLTTILGGLKISQKEDRPIVAAKKEVRAARISLLPGASRLSRSLGSVSQYLNRAPKTVGEAEGMDALRHQELVAEGRRLYLALSLAKGRGADNKVVAALEGRIVENCRSTSLLKGKMDADYELSLANGGEEPEIKVAPEPRKGVLGRIFRKKTSVVTTTTEETAPGLSEAAAAATDATAQDEQPFGTPVLQG